MKDSVFNKLGSPWALFLLFGVVFSFLSFASWTPGVKGWLFAAFLLLFVFFLVKHPHRGRPPAKADFEKEEPVLFPGWFFTAAALAAVGLRFFKLTTFRHWLSSDEALQGYFAIDLIHQWSWRFFYTSGQHPPLLIWALKGFFQFFESPFFNLWFLPALLSTLFVFLAYGAARSFFSRNLSLVYAWLLAASFWPIYFGRFCVQGVWVPVFEAAVFLVGGALLKAKGKRARLIWASTLGLLTGIGTWTFTSWIVVAFFVFCLMFYGLRDRAKNGRPFVLFSLFLFLGCLPWVLAAFRERFGGYLVGVSMLSGFFSWKEQFLTSVSYLTNLFWGTLREPVSYGPSWGGMLNPLLSACFLLGVFELYRHRATLRIKVLGTAFAVLLMPGLLSADHVEMFRIIQLMPLLLLVAAAGILGLLVSLPVGWRKGTVILLLLLSSLFDVARLGKAIPDSAPLFSNHEAKQPAVQDENYWAYQWLEPAAEQLGPGLVFTDFILLAHSHTLAVASYHFNALSNPAFDPSKARWAAVITNIHYAPSLLKRFPGSQWHPISPSPVEDGGSVVGLIPITPQNQEALLSWVPVARYFHGLGIEAENMMNNGGEYQEALRKLPAGYVLLKGDPFLESCYGEWMAQYHEGSGFEWNIQALQRAVQKGYRTANLYYKLGSFYYWNRQPEKARQAYLMAAQCRPNYTNAKEVLAALWPGRK